MEQRQVTDAVTPFSSRRERGTSFVVPPLPKPPSTSSIMSFFSSSAPSQRSMSSLASHQQQQQQQQQHSTKQMNPAEQEESASPGSFIPRSTSSASSGSRKAAAREIDSGGVVPGAFNIRRRARGEVPSWGQDNQDNDDDNFEEYDSSSAAPSRDLLPNMSSMPESYENEYDTASVTAVYNTRNTKQHHGWVWTCMMAVTLIVSGIAIGIMVIVARGRTQPDENTVNELLCDFSGVEQPDIKKQCDCNDSITVLSEDTLVKYELLSPILGDSSDWSSCSFQNIALMTMATHSQPAQDEVLCNQYALMVLFLSMNGSNWMNQDGWGLAERDDLCPCCMYGVTCEGDSVVAIDLPNNGVSGSIPSVIGLLTALTMLDLSRNPHLTGSIPTELGLLTGLLVLSIGFNSLKGPIPSHLGLLTQLQTMEVTGNQLISSIPSELGELTSLEFFLCSMNGLTGSLPSELERLTQLKELDVGRNGIDHQGPLFAWNITTLQRINVMGCGIAGSLPAESMAFLTALTDLTMASNDLTGTLPTEMALLTKLQTLLLDDNRLTGTLPETLPLTMLDLNLSDNTLTGTIPEAYGELVNLESMVLITNQLTGTVSDSVCELRTRGQLTNFETDCAFDDLVAKVDCPYPDCCTQC